MRQAGRTMQHDADAALSKEIMFNSLLEAEEEHTRSMGMQSCREPMPGQYHNNASQQGLPSHPSMPAHIPRGVLTVMGELQEPPCSPTVAAAAAAVGDSCITGWQGGPAPMQEREDHSVNHASAVNPVDIGIKVANEIMGLHSQAAATGRALAQSTRQAEYLQEENERLKEELDRVHQARQAHEDEAARLKAKLSQRSIELMLLEQKVQAADERTEAQAQKAAQQAEATAVANERYDSLVSRLMVVVVKASVAAEQLEKALMAANKTPGMRCNCKPALHHGLDALTSLADFRDTWMSNSAMNANSSSRTYSSSAAAGQAGQMSPRLQSSMRRVIMDKETSSQHLDNRPLCSTNSGSDCLVRGVGSGSASPLSRHGSMRPNSAGDLSRQPMLRPAGASGELGRHSGLRPAGSGEIRAHRPEALRSAEVPRLQLAMLQEQMQQEQQQSARHSSGYDSPRRLPARSSMSMSGSAASSPRRAPALSKAEALEAAADLVYGSFVQQQQQQLQPQSSSRTSASAAGSRQPPPWNSGRGAQRRSSQAAPAASPTKSGMGSPRRSVYFDDDARERETYVQSVRSPTRRRIAEALKEPIYEHDDDFEGPEGGYDDYDDYQQPTRLAQDRSCSANTGHGWY